MTRVRVEPSWLASREPADAAARADDLVEEIRRGLPDSRPLVIYDLACGTGAMLRWLAPQLPGPQHWIGYDLDVDLLAAIETAPPTVAADGSTVTTEVRRRDVTLLERAELADAALVTSSALLDLLTSRELRRFVCTCAAAHCPALITLTVTGGVQLWPPHPLDAVVAAAFNAHQRRAVAGDRLLGPDAADAAARMFTELGCHVVTRASAWQLGPTRRALTRAWFCGWIAAACEQDSHLGVETRSYARRRLADAEAGRLRARVEHRDLLVRPPIAPQLGEPELDQSRVR